MRLYCYSRTQYKSQSELYNKIRCLTVLYPFTYIEDEEANKLLFTGS